METIQDLTRQSCVATVDVLGEFTESKDQTIQTLNEYKEVLDAIVGATRPSRARDTGGTRRTCSLASERAKRRAMRPCKASPTPQTTGRRRPAVLQFRHARSSNSLPRFTGRVAHERH